MVSKAEVSFKVCLPAGDRDLIQFYICKGHQSTHNATNMVSRRLIPLQHLLYTRMNISEGFIRGFSRLNRKQTSST